MTYLITIGYTVECEANSQKEAETLAWAQFDEDTHKESAYIDEVKLI